MSTLAWYGSVPHNRSPCSLQNGRPEALIDNDRISPDHCYVFTVWFRDEHGTTMIVDGCVPNVAVHMIVFFQFFFVFSKRFDCVQLSYMHCLVR